MNSYKHSRLTYARRLARRRIATRPLVPAPREIDRAGGGQLALPVGGRQGERAEAKDVLVLGLEGPLARDQHAQARGGRARRVGHFVGHVLAVVEHDEQPQRRQHGGQFFYW